MASSRPEAEIETDTAQIEETTVDTRRRKALLKLGIATGVVYAAPTVLRIDRNLAMAMGSTCNAGGGNGSEGPSTPSNDCDPGNSGPGPGGGNDGGEPP